ncbi:MAG: radical SAM protein [Deltaproteobacteria bacterium]|nr:radical SAM protein [Deltaproteobacteria bacterium]
MVLEVRPMGVKCNLSCKYCYQHKYRRVGKELTDYDLDIITGYIKKRDQPVDIFGGEPLLIPIHDLEKLFGLAHEMHGYSTIQTNGTLMNDNHIKLFKKYNVYVGLSCDGPNELNNMRFAGSIDKTLQATKKTLDAMHQLRKNGLDTYFQVQLTKINATGTRLNKLMQWFKELDDLGIKYCRIHVIDNNCLDSSLCLTEQEYIRAYSKLYELQKTLVNLHFDIFDDMEKMLQLKDDDVTCVFRGCDHYTTEAVMGINGNGEQHNCGAMDDEGVYFQKPDQKGYERAMMLYQTPYEYGGCRGCRFFLACKGHCPGNAIDNDWRNRSVFCRVWQELFSLIEEDLERKGITPVSRHPKRKEWEDILWSHWQRGVNLILEKDLN